MIVGIDLDVDFEHDLVNEMNEFERGATDFEFTAEVEEEYVGVGTLDG